MGADFIRSIGAVPPFRWQFAQKDARHFRRWTASPTISNFSFQKKLTLQIRSTTMKAIIECLSWLVDTV